MSPASIVLGRGKIDGNNLKATFGRYYQVYSGTDNTNRERRTSAICLPPSNSHGKYYFMNIETGEEINGNRFTELSMPQHIIDRVHALATAEYAPDLDKDGCPVFEWDLGAPINNDDKTIPNIQPVQEAPDDESEDEDSDEEDDDEDSDEEDDDNASTSSSSCHDDIYDDKSITDNTEVKIEDESIADVRSDDESIADVYTKSEMIRDLEEFMGCVWHGNKKCC